MFTNLHVELAWRNLQLPHGKQPIISHRRTHYFTYLLLDKPLNFQFLEILLHLSKPRVFECSIARAHLNTCIEECIKSQRQLLHVIDLNGITRYFVKKKHDIFSVFQLGQNNCNNERKGTKDLGSPLYVDTFTWQTISFLYQVDHQKIARIIFEKGYDYVVFSVNYSMRIENLSLNSRLTHTSNSISHRHHVKYSQVAIVKQS